MRTLVLAQHDNATLADSTGRALTAALALGQEVDVLVAGAGCEPVAKAASKLDCVAKVLFAESKELAHDLAEPLAALIASLAHRYSAIVAPATSQSKNVMPRVAALLDVMQISDVTKVIAPDTFERPIYAGNAIQTVKSKGSVRVLTIRTSLFKPVGDGGSAAIDPITFTEVPGRSSFVGAELSKSERPDLLSAKIIIAGGRALQSRENFAKYIESIADKLGAAIGASRAAVDAGFAPNDVQIGQTGKVVAPDVYIAVGISGAIQHLAGMKDSKVIVAINKDPEAPIFQIADYALVADLFEALPQLAAELDRKANRRDRLQYNERSS